MCWGVLVKCGFTTTSAGCIGAEKSSLVLLAPRGAITRKQGETRFLKQPFHVLESSKAECLNSLDSRIKRMHSNGVLFVGLTSKRKRPWPRCNLCTHCMPPGIDWGACSEYLKLYRMLGACLAISPDANQKGKNE